MKTHIKGQEQVYKLLDNAIEHNRIAQSYIFYGPEGVGKFTTALIFAMTINCLSKDDIKPCGGCSSCHKMLEFNHPDLYYIFPTPSMKANTDGELNSKSISEYLSYVENRKNTPWNRFYFSGTSEIRKESIENLQKKLEFSQREAKFRICIFEDFEEMNLNTVNSFLKTLEEPPANTIFILITTKLQSLLPTVISRCQLLFFKPVSSRIIAEEVNNKFPLLKNQVRSIARTANGNMEYAFRLAQGADQTAKDLSLQFINAVLDQNDEFIQNLVLSAKENLKVDFIHDLLNQIILFYSSFEDYISRNSEIDDQLFVNIIHRIIDTYDFAKIKVNDIIIKCDELHKRLDGNANIQYLLIYLFNELIELSK